MTAPLTATERVRHYKAQNGRDLVTRRQWRRVARKQNRAMRRAA